ncbi:MAG: DUF1684 domain-containing protein [Gemmatimonadota bacterium]|nr:DUF1684 domain-containing protein [Gemmatimonadota bacterium]
MRLAALALLVPALAFAQTPPDLAAERADYTRWLETSPGSPFAGLYHQFLHDDLVFGPGGDPALAELPPATLRQERRRLVLRTADGTRTVPRNHDVPLGGFHIRVAGERGNAVVTVFGTPRDAVVPGWYPYAAEVVVDGTLEPPSRPESRRMLGLDGVTIEASHAGTFVGAVAGQAARLTVFRMPEPGTEESELMIFFRDETNGRGTYPPGRFLALRPLGGDRYRADFNRARNPFCAYNGIFPCPLPWAGNAIAAAIEAGEKYVAK